MIWLTKAATIASRPPVFNAASWSDAARANASWADASWSDASWSDVARADNAGGDFGTPALLNASQIAEAQAELGITIGLDGSVTSLTP